MFFITKEMETRIKRKSLSTNARPYERRMKQLSR